jgi:hypothetical protein
MHLRPYSTTFNIKGENGREIGGTYWIKQYDDAIGSSLTGPSCAVITHIIAPEDRLRVSN